MKSASIQNPNYMIPDYFRNPVIRPYLANVRDWQGYIRFLGLPDRRENPDVVIDRLFVTPLLTRRYVSPDENPQNWADEAETLIDALAENRRLVLLGDPGIGKSTFLNYVAWLLSRPATNALIDRLGWRLPLPMVLREMEVRGARRFDDLLEAFLNHKMSAPLLVDDRDYLMRTLDEGQAFLLLDGIDELGDRETRERLRSAVFEGMSRYPDCHWLMTSRIVGYDEAPFDAAHNRAVARHAGDVLMNVSQPLGDHDGGGSDNALPSNDSAGELSRALLRRGARDRFPVEPVYGSMQTATRYIAPFDDRRIEAFARNWYVLREAAAIRAGENADHLVRAVHADPSILRLARVPNLLTMMALIHRVEATLPHGRALLYERIAEAYLESIDKFRGIAAGPHDLPRKKGWLARVGIEMQRRRMSKGMPEATAILMDADTVKGWLSEEMGRSDTYPDTPSAEEFLKVVGRRSGLFLPRGEGRYAFVHLSFQEYFAAVALKREVTRLRWAKDNASRLGFDRGTLADWAGLSVWRETFSFLFELLASEEEDDWHADLLDCVFGENFSRLDDSESDEVSVALGHLLARLVVNSRSGLPPLGRYGAIAHCVKTRLRLQFGENLSNILADLFNDDIRHNAEVFKEICMQAEQREIQFLDLSNIPISNLSPLASLPRLQSLVLRDTPVSDVAPLANLTELESVYLWGTKVLDLAPIENLPRLRSLDWGGPEISDLAPLANFSALESLHVWYTSVSSIAPLAGLTALKVLGLRDIPVSDLTPLAGLSKLESLDLGHIPAVDLTPLADLVALKSLLLFQTQVSDLAPLSHLVDLQSLRIWSKEISDLLPLSDLPDLRSIYLVDTQISDLSPLVNITTLESLSFVSAPISDLTPLANLANLQSLALCNTRISDLQPLADLNELHSLFLESSEISDITPLANLTALRSLTLSSPNVSVDSVEELRSRLPDVRVDYWYWKERVQP